MPYKSRNLLLYNDAPTQTGLKKTDFQEGKLVKKDIEGKSVVLVMLNGKLFAMDSVLT